MTQSSGSEETEPVVGRAGPRKVSPRTRRSEGREEQGTPKFDVTSREGLRQELGEADHSGIELGDRNVTDCLLQPEGL